MNSLITRMKSAGTAATSVLFSGFSKTANRFWVCREENTFKETKLMIVSDSNFTSINLRGYSFFLVKKIIKNIRTVDHDSNFWSSPFALLFIFIRTIGRRILYTMNFLNIS
ncbi:hypothetical protein RF11_14771 [Thelohanellus kitauei]|uniref:Uncharacterized protein n=1 Tax=Thelohanellus kitauei TaxID=669202 RepID=A0A0C2MQI9_THEKT|nr:hypothetical protein RF11_14771 [Thelohanellus kitauei]